MQYSVRDIQDRLRQIGYDPGPVDGVMGPKTEAAISLFKQTRGLRARPYVGPITLQHLFGSDVPETASPAVPWVNELGRYLGAHERRDFRRLYAWLRSDGATLGDPRQLPWCGDAVHTAIRLALPNESFPGRVGKNPYLARNWLEFGRSTDLRYGAVAVYWRGSPGGASGHVGFVVGVDRERGRIRTRGGNQGNSVSDAWMSADRLLGLRRPATWPHQLPPCPIMNSAGAVLSTNEA